MTTPALTEEVLKLPSRERYELGKALLESVAEEAFAPSLDDELAAWDRAADEVLLQADVATEV